MHARHARGDAGDELVVDGAGGLGPVGGGRLAARAGPEQDDLVPGGDLEVADVDDDEEDEEEDEEMDKGTYSTSTAVARDFN